MIKMPDIWTIGVIAVILLMLVLLYFNLPKDKPKDDLKDFEDILSSREEVKAEV